MKIIFLDIDGVLNSWRYDFSRTETGGNIDESRLPLLKQLIDRTGAAVVLTSSWRRHWDPEGVGTDDTGKELEQCFGRYGIVLYDRTPEIRKDRVQEIRAWLALHRDVERFVILDDIRLGWDELEDYTVKTNYRIGRGLEPHHIDKAIQILSKAE